jgi:serine protease Do
LGVGIQPVTQQLADRFDVQPKEGVVVTEVFDGTPAAKAGLKSGDVIVEFAGAKVSSPQELQVAVERCEMGKSHALTVVRDGKHIQLTFVPEEQPADFGLARGESMNPPTAESSRLENWGLEISPLNESVAKKLGMTNTEGVVITDVRSGSPADQAGLSSGMVITEVNRQSVASASDVTAAIGKDTEEGTLLLVRTARGSQFVVIHG